MFGYSIVKTKRLYELERVNARAHEVYRWFAGWQDLDIIWKYIFKSEPHGSISMARYDYAKARKTDEYGEQVSTCQLCKIQFKGKGLFCSYNCLFTDEQKNGRHS